jgi:hypothetical protein
MEKIKCTIERITFQNPENGYSVLQATIKGYRDEQTLVGTFHEVTVGAVLTVEGSWTIERLPCYTIGRLCILEEVIDEYSTGTAEKYFCDTLEPTWRDYANGAYKVKGRSAIPEGRYAVVISWSPKFKQWLPILLGGPEFNRKWQGIRIHAGNTAKDTEGCILVGKNREVGKVLDSRIWVHRLKQKIVEAKDRGEAVWITIK